MIYFSLLSMRLSLSHNLDHEFDRLTRVHLSRFLCHFLNRFFFILSFNIGLIENLTS